MVKSRLQSTTFYWKRPTRRTYCANYVVIFIRYIIIYLLTYLLTSLFVFMVRLLLCLDFGYLFMYFGHFSGFWSILECVITNMQFWLYRRNNDRLISSRMFTCASGYSSWYEANFYSACNCIARAVLATVIPSVCPSVCPSVTRRYCVKTTARSTVQFAPFDSKMCLVLYEPKNIPQGWPLTPEILAQSDLPTPEGYEFWHVLPCSASTVRDRKRSSITPP